MSRQRFWSNPCWVSLNTKQEIGTYKHRDDACTKPGFECRLHHGLLERECKKTIDLLAGNRPPPGSWHELFKYQAKMLFCPGACSRMRKRVLECGGFDGIDGTGDGQPLEAGVSIPL